ncbi:hypothetical protein LCGC14_1505480 [marine sediment metagenome]|uniref:NIF system FeS cluster assembly NifU N-terminal domain-containing protein n=1 Tax=marine sediment metagenome TaxID=412755 RepID=A0A0F9J2V2_9ZZZZ
MNKDFDQFVDNLQKEIIKKEIKDHNEKIVDLFHNPINMGKPPDEDITVFEELRGGPKGYFLGLYLMIEDKLIIKAHFETDGCGVMVAIGSQLTLLLEGKSIESAENLKPEEIDKALMGVPQDEFHCIDLAIETLKSIIKKYTYK